MITDEQVDHLSYSQVSLYLKNPREWWFKYIKYPNERRDWDSWALRLGRAYHGAVEVMYKRKSLEEAVQRYELELRKEDKAKYADDYNTVMNAIYEYYYGVFPLYQSRVLAKDVETMETAFMIEGVGVPFHLRVDASTVDGVIIDHKTVGYRNVRAKDSLQGMLYAYKYYVDHGKLPRLFEYHKVYKSPQKRNNKIVEVDTASFSLAEVLNAADIVRSVYRSIKAEIFPWTTSSNMNSKLKNEWENMLISRTS